MPEWLVHIWRYFLELHAHHRPSNGFAPGRLNRAAFDEWAEENGGLPSAHEVKMIRALDELWLEENAKQMDKRRRRKPPPKT